MGRTDYFFDERDTPGSEKDTGNTLLLNFGFKSTGRKGKKGGGVLVKKVGKPCKTVYPVRPQKMAANMVSIEAGVVLPY